MLGQRRRRWTNIEPILGQFLVSAGLHLYAYWMTPRIRYSAHYHRVYYTLQAFEQFGALYMQNQREQNIRPGRDSNLLNLEPQLDLSKPSRR